MTPLDMGVGARRILSRAGAGTVHSVYAKAVYLRFPQGLVALTGPGVARGPLHLRCSALPAVAAGDRVVTTGTGLQVRRAWISLACPTWRPLPPPAGDLLAHRAVGVDATAHVPPSLLLTGGFGGLDHQVSQYLRAGDLSPLARLLGGRGPGLTPSGDDVLAGVFLVARALWGAAGQPHLVALAGTVRTNDIAAAFLAWAARGRLIEPAHTFLDAVADGQVTRARTAVDTLLTFGQSSGQDLVSGLARGLRHLPAHPDAG
ncbi:oxamate carbamoyltransferase subunit AllH family protein [Streptomyces chiangmaiensis]|uniref:DUF2877 domain-containing protein n=1 Tax=Streptomyces chiangmaiensis TaxID=766497 RepID=A0ABU7FP27_9ACTN|nr:DUF2877 domain-containing protein [Streptomyces chiangmaiensis]MED7824829.1 DUF2877 domain-containing protein [Streptomyces chiangmaiensis]